MREGLLPTTVTRVMRLDTDEKAARSLTVLFGELFDPDETAIASFEDEATKEWRIDIYFAHEPDEDAIRALVAETIGEDAAVRAVFEGLTARDWVGKSLEGLSPVEAGRFLVHGSHDRPAAARRTNMIRIEIEAALAFGTGHHGTTRGCLLAFDRVARRRRPRKVLDVGTGTGILAMAAARLIHRPVVASDIDPVAVDVARANARLNATAAYLRLAVASGLRHPTIARGIPYDLIMANILNKPLTLMAPALARAAGRSGVLVLSGLLERDVPGILSVFRHQGFALEKRDVAEGWATLVLRRGGAAPRPRR